MNGYLNQANADEIVLHYERSVSGDGKDPKHAANLRAIHTDLTARFDAVDARVAAQ